MDDDKKKKEHKVEIEVVEILILLVFVIGILWVWNFSTYFTHFKTYTSAVTPGLIVGLKSFIGIVEGFGLILSILLTLGIIVAGIGLKEVRHKEKKLSDARVEQAVSDKATGDPDLALRWRKILELTDSTNQNDWRQAIIDADSILDEIVAKMGYQGDSIGERLRNADKADFKTLDMAGEAHGVRNRIAHDGSNFLLNQQEAKRVIGLYKDVFTEFFYI